MVYYSRYLILQFLRFVVFPKRLINFIKKAMKNNYIDRFFVVCFYF